MLAFPINKDVFKLARKLGHECGPTSPEYVAARKSLSFTKAVRQVDATDADRLRQLLTQFTELDIGAGKTNLLDKRGRPRGRVDSSHALLHEDPATIEAKLAFLESRPLCFDLHEQTTIVRSATEVFTTMDVGTARESIRWLAGVTLSQKACRHIVRSIPEVLLGTAQLEKSVDLLRSYGFNDAAISKLLSSVKAVRFMMVPGFEVDFAARGAVLDVVLPRERWRTEITEEEAVLLWKPLITLRERLRLMERLDCLDMPIASTVKRNMQGFASSIGVRPAYIRFFAKRHAQLQRSLRDTYSADQIERLMAPPLSHKLLMTIPVPDDWEPGSRHKPDS